MKHRYDGQNIENEHDWILDIDYKGIRDAEIISSYYQFQ